MIECQEQLGLRYFGRRAAAEVAAALLPHAMEDDRLAHLAALALQTLRAQRIIVPSPLAVERLCGELRHQARRDVYRRLISGLSADQRRRLDALAGPREDSNQTQITWLRQAPQAATPGAMLGLLERLGHVREIGISPSHGQLVHPARMSQLEREADRTTVQHIARLERQRRHATLVAMTMDFATSLTDQAINVFDRLISGIFRKSEERHARAFQADARAINEKVRLYARVGAALITAQTDKQNAFDAITSVIPWERFCKSVADAQALARPEEFDAFDKLAEHYAAIRRWSPAFLAAFAFDSAPASAARPHLPRCCGASRYCAK